MKVKTIVYVSILCILMPLLNGCGYTTRVLLPSGVRTVYVPNFKMAIPPSEQFTYESGLEFDVTNAIIDQLLYDGNLDVVREDVADAYLLGEIVGYRQEALSYNTLEGVQQYRLVVTVKLVFQRRDPEEVIWEEGSFTGQTSYYIEGSSAISESAAADNAITNLATNIVNRIVEDW